MSSITSNIKKKADNTAAMNSATHQIMEMLIFLLIGVTTGNEHVMSFLTNNQHGNYFLSGKQKQQHASLIGQY